MKLKDEFIDVHTHQEGHPEDVVAIRNLYPENPVNFDTVRLYSMGIHPWFIPEKGVERLLKIVEESAGKEEFVAIGECGLDKLSETPFDLQQLVFEKHIEIAEKVQKPLVIHCVRSYNELVRIKARSGSTVEWIVHGFNAKLQVADMLLRYEMFLSFGKALLHPGSNASKVLPQVDSGMFLLETDDSKTGIVEIYQAAADRLNLRIDILKHLIMKNFINCFRL